MQLRYHNFTAFLVLALVILASLSLTAAKTVLTSVTGSGFGPASQSANVGDVIVISFTVGSATFTQSTFEDPCTPLEGGKDSGLKTIAPGAGPQDFRFTLDTSNSLYFFNAVSDQCQEGFVFALNASPQQVAQFKSNAARVGSRSDFKSPKPAVVTQPPRADSNSPDVVTVISQRPVSAPNAISTSTSESGVTPPASPLHDVNPTISSTSPSITGNPVAAETGSSTGSLGIIPLPIPSGDPFSKSTSIFPTNPSTPSTTGSQPTTGSLGSSNKKTIVATAIGISFGFLALIAIAVVVITRRLRGRPQLLPTATDLATNPQSVSGKQFPAASSRFKRIFKPRGWNRLQGKEPRITPFFPEQRTAETDDVDHHIVTRADSFTTGHRLSQSTLVDSRWREEIQHSRSGSASSLVVETSETEKSVTIHRGRVLINNRTSLIPRTSNSSKLDVGQSPV